MGRIEEKKKEKRKDEEKDLFSNLKNMLILAGASGAVLLVLFFLFTAEGSEWDVYSDGLTVSEELSHPNIVAEDTDPQDTVIVEYYHDTQCPHCQNFEKNHLNDVLEQKVATGEATVVFRKLPIVNERSSVQGNILRYYWDNDPQNYMQYHQILKNNLDVAVDNQRASDLMVENNLQPISGSANYDSVLEENGEEADRLGIRGTPSFVIDGQVYSASDSDELIEHIDQHSS